MNFSGKCNGQIKLSIKPLENMETHGQMSSQNLNPLTVPLSIEVDDNESPSSVLSRTLKRKFTELEEITQRLKARLFDVTGDENFDPDEEFERELNTPVDDMEEEFDDAENCNFGWLNRKPSDAEVLEINQPSTSAASQSVNDEPHRVISGASNPVPKQPVTLPLSFENLLKSYDLDTIINPNIFKNILDPNIAVSESTPTLNRIVDPQEIASPNREQNTAERDDATTISSNMSPDHVQTIQQAMQQTSIDEKEDESLACRPVPEGEQFSSNE